MTKQEIIKAIQENKIQVKASTDQQFATIRWFDNDTQTWKEANTFVRNIIQGASVFVDLGNDTNVVKAQNGREVINILYDLINKNTNAISNIELVSSKVIDDSATNPTLGVNTWKVKLDEIYEQIEVD